MGLEFAQRPDVGKRAARVCLAVAIVFTAYYVFRPVASPRRPLDASVSRLDAIRSAQVYLPTDVRHKDLRRGPRERGGFAPNQLVRCDYLQAAFDGKSPKFECALAADDRVKVKYGADNGEVYAEVAATWLFWALGFGADRVYPVRVECHGCPAGFEGSADPLRTVLVDPASIERKFDGAPLVSSAGAGWAWPELDLIDEHAGGAPRAHVDALKLLAAMLQHTDSKPVNQRIVILPDGRPFMLVQDLGLTFGRANVMNRDRIGSVDYGGWAHTPVWAPGPGCVANIERSFTGTLDHPRIGEAGRALLSGLLDQLSREQIEDLFDVARFAERSRHSVTDWTEAFLHKRAEIRDKHCG
jgi:hypothetical protein